jgi:3-hydroxyisobutyrate dehydrogenase-like beta-hydroxyacid dehydrogenase
MNPERIGIVGLGGMGRPMARNLAAAGHIVYGYDISAAALDAAAREGVTPLGKPAAIGQACDLVLTMVWDDAALRDVLFGPHGLLADSRIPSCTIDLSTTSVALAHEAGARFAARNAAFLDGAVIGGGVAAVKAARSPIVVGGDRASFDRWRAVLERLGTCDHVGPLGSAKALKLVNNLLVGVLTAANAEALSLGVSLGASLPDLVGALCRGPAWSHVLESYMGRYVETGTYGEGLIGHDLMAKDLRLAAELAESLECETAYPRLAQQLYLEFGRSLGAARAFPSAFEHYRTAPARTGAQARAATAIA